MPRLKLVIEYEGTHYVGWQVQLNGPSVQARVQQALEHLVGSPVSLTAAGRTDSGVHARGQVVAFDSPRELPLKAYSKGLNSLLPLDIAVVSAAEVSPEFDPRRWSTGKRYRYLINNRNMRSPLRRFTHWEVFKPLDTTAMSSAAGYLLGKHDFSAFRASNCQAAHAIRAISRLEVCGAAGDEISFVVEGTAFLKHMVRNVVGTLVEVGRGRFPPTWVKTVLEGKDRRKAGSTAPPQGLCLEEVFYGDGPRVDDDDDE